MSNTTQPKQWAIPFFTIWTGQAFSLLGSALAQFALVWWLTEETGSATVLATATLAAMLPQVLLGPIAGALVDRWNRRLVMIAADGLIALSILVLAVLFASDLVQPWHVYAIMFVRSLGGAFHFPAMRASTSLMVPDKHLVRLAGINDTLHGGMGIVAPPLGALLLGILPMYGIVLIDVCTALLAIAPLLFVSIPQPQRRPLAAAQARPSVIQDVYAALRYVWRWPGLFALLVIVALLNFVARPGATLMPLLITRHFGGTSVQLGWANAASGLGVVLGGLILGAWGGFRRRVHTSLVGLVGTAVGMLLTGLAPATALPLAICGAFISGLMGPIFGGPLIAIFQTTIPPEMQGRVFTMISSISMGAIPLSMVIAGPVGDWLGVRAWYILAGITIALASLAIYSIPTIMRLEDNVERK